MTGKLGFMLHRPDAVDVKAAGCHAEVMDPWAPADPLGRALQLLRMDGAFYCASRLSAPWGMSLPAMAGYVWFHAAVTGSFTLLADDDRAVPVSAGELALVPHGTGHRLQSAPGVPTPDILSIDREIVSDRYETLRYGGGGAETYVICGAVRLEHPAAHQLVRSLPATIVVSTSHDDTEWLHSTLRLLGAEARQARPGSEAVITRLADIIVIQAIRAWLDSDPAARTGWLGALRDPLIGQAIALIHTDPGIRGRSRIWRHGWRCRGRPLPPVSPNSSANRRWSTSPVGGCIWRSRRSRAAPRPSPSFRRSSAIGPRRHSPGRSNA